MQSNLFDAFKNLITFFIELLEVIRIFIMHIAFFTSIIIDIFEYFDLSTK